MYERTNHFFKRTKTSPYEPKTPLDPLPIAVFPCSPSQSHISYPTASFFTKFSTFKAVKCVYLLVEGNGERGRVGRGTNLWFPWGVCSYNSNIVFHWNWYYHFSLRFSLRIHFIGKLWRNSETQVALLPKGVMSTALTELLNLPLDGVDVMSVSNSKYVYVIKTTNCSSFVY